MTVVADLHTLTGAYAAHALDEAECGDFERHLARCEACAGEVREFAATLARLGSAEALVARPELKVRVLAAVSSVRQLPPITVGPAAAGRRLGQIARWWPRFALTASVALTVALGGLALQQHGQAQRAASRAGRFQQQQADFAALLAAPDARTATARTGSGVGTVVWSPALGRAGFLAAGLPVLPRGSTYQLWFDDAGAMRPAGLLQAAEGSVILSGPIRGAAGIGITVEPSGGSQHPTGRPLMLLPFT